MDSGKKQIKRPLKEYHLADFFNMYWDKYLENPKKYVYPHHFKAVNAIRSCRSAKLGVDIYSCPNCGTIKEFRYSCKHRFCPTCSWRDTVKWAEKIKQRMLATEHRHVVFTLPHKLISLIKKNDYSLLSLLMKSSANSIKDWMKHKFGITPGIISVLHTYGEKKNYHVHVHMIVSWGGVRIKHNNLKRIEKSFVGYNFMQKKFRNQFEDELIRMHDSGLLNHEYKDRREFMKFIKTINKKEWVLHFEPPMDTPEQVIRYIGRYSKRACISEYKITNIKEEKISFKYKDYKDRDINNKAKEKKLELHYSDFFPRLLQHVPLPYFKIVRYYGVYANKGNIPAECFVVPKKEEPKKPKQEKDKCEECGTSVEYVHTKFEIMSRSYKGDEKIKTFEKITIDRNDSIHRHQYVA